MEERGIAMSLSFAVTAYNEMSDGRKRGYRLLECLQAATRHPKIKEVVVVDDGSDDWDKLVAFLESHGESTWDKLVLHHNGSNKGVFGNKLLAVCACTGDWVVNCDSDNLMDPTYLDLVWYCPSFARPEFDYRALVGEWDLASICELLSQPLSECLLNTGNQTVHRESFLRVFDGYRGRRFDLLLPDYLGLGTEERTKDHWRIVHDAKDSLIFNMEWLSSGGKLSVVPGLWYDHHYTSGPESNYARAPIEKDRLNEVLIAELRKRSLEESGNRVKQGEYG
jgi:glycosyltransferase involved in cell wall biosynthesis